MSGLCSLVELTSYVFYSLKFYFRCLFIHITITPVILVVRHSDTITIIVIISITIVATVVTVVI